MDQIAEDAPYALVVDDDFLIRMGAMDILSDAGFQALEADHGDAASSEAPQQLGQARYRLRVGRVLRMGCSCDLRLAGRQLSAAGGTGTDH